MSYKGKFKPHNPGKYVGNSLNIVYRSLWELRFMRYLDSHPNVVQWASEEITIPYYSPVDKKIHRETNTPSKILTNIIPTLIKKKNSMEYIRTIGLDLYLKVKDKGPFNGNRNILLRDFETLKETYGG